MANTDNTNWQVEKKKGWGRASGIRSTKNVIAINILIKSKIHSRQSLCLRSNAASMLSLSTLYLLTSSSFVEVVFQVQKCGQTNILYKEGQGATKINFDLSASFCKA